ncbi:MAG: protein kinase [Acidobacteriota bacterium]|nr:protein kinase [Acidobacteriota bacterium]
MNAERWQQIERIFQSALALKGSEERADYVNRVCAEDEALQQEVESLLAAYEKTGSFMNVPAHEVAARLIAADYSDLQETREEDLSRSPTLRLNTEVAGNADEEQKPKSGSTGRRRIILIGLFFTLMCICAGVNSYHSILYFHTAGDPGWMLGLDGRVQTYGGVSGANLSSLRDGDDVVLLDGREFKNAFQYFETFARFTPRADYTIVVRRDGRTERLALRTASYHFWIRVNVILLQLVIPATFLLTGLIVFLLKPNDKQALLLALMLGMFGAAVHPLSLLTADYPWWLTGFIFVCFLVAGTSTMPITLHFFLIFPERSPLLARFPRWEYYIYPLLLVTIYPVLVIAAFLLATEPEGITGVFQNSRWIWVVLITISVLYMLGALLSLLVNYRKAGQVSRRKLRIIMVGVTAGFIPAFLLRVLFPILKPSLSPLLLIIISFTLTALLFVPLSFAYAIVRHQVIPVSLIIRRGVQYLFAKNGLRIIFALPIIGLLVTIIANPNRTLPEILFQNSIYFYLLLIAAFSLMFRRRLSEWVDRKFFREAYSQERILRALVENLKPLDSLQEMSKQVSQQVERALHPARIYLFHREEERRDLTLGHSSNVTAHGLHIPAEFQLLRFMEREGRAVEFPLRNSLPFVEKAWLAGLGTKLIVPVINTTGRLSGLFLLGEKRSEIPYTATDRQLLKAVAGQIALVYENVQLKEHVAREHKIKREVLARIEKQDINLLKECPTCGACFDNSWEFCAKDQSELTLSLPVERTIEERYRLDQLVGRGGMGAVYEATDIRLHRKVAVKILSGSLFGNSEALQRFEREAQAAARLSHPNIIAVHDYGRLSTEGAYLVMDLEHGETLGAIIKRESKLDPARVAEVFDQVLDGVSAAHRAGVIHRDLKPDNILITEGEKGRLLAKVLDFGLAKLAQPDGTDLSGVTATMTPLGTLMGTFGYMAPEQLTGEAVDERSDLFAVGVMVVEALTGRRPFGGQTYHELLTAMLHGTFRLPHDSPEGRRLDDVLQRCLAKDRVQRYASVGEMQRELIPALLGYC